MGREDDIATRPAAAAAAAAAAETLDAAPGCKCSRKLGSSVEER